MKVDVLDQEGKVTGSAVLPKEIFEVPMNADLLHQVIVSQMANKRQVSAHTKDRSEVRGGGKKPWRQKGTGRARHGSSRSPLWKGGGVTFGPRKDKNLKREIPNKIRKAAITIVLSEKARKNLLVVLEDIRMEKPKTQEMNAILGKLPCKNKCLLILPKYEKNLILSSRNIEGAGVLEARNITALDLMNYKYLLMPKETIKVIRETIVK